MMRVHYSADPLGEMHRAPDRRRWREGGTGCERGGGGGAGGHQSEGSV